jgi:hypothetical protein
VPVFQYYVVMPISKPWPQVSLESCADRFLHQFRRECGALHFARPRSASLAHFDDLLIEDDLGLLKFNLQRP